MANSATGGQQALCTAHGIDPATPGLVLELVLGISDDISVSRFADALAGLARRHETLRTRFRPTGSGWRPVVDPFDDRYCVVSDTEPGGRPVLDLERGPLFRAVVRPTARQAHVRVHHAVADLWSLGLLMDELINGSEVIAGTAAQPSPAQLDRAWSFWRGLLTDEVEPPRLPPGSGPTGRDVMRTAHHVPLDFGPHRSAAVAGLAHTAGVTRYAALLAAQAVALGRLTGSDRVPVAVPLHGRRSGSYRADGYHVSTVALPIDLAGHTVRSLVSEVGSRLRGALAHQALGYPELVARSLAERGPTVPAPTVALVLQQDPPGAPAGLGAALLGLRPLPMAGGGELTVVEPPPSIGPFGMSTLLVEHEGRLCGRVELDPAAHPMWLADRFADCLVAAVDAMTANPDAAVTGLAFADHSTGQLHKAPADVLTTADTLHGLVLDAAARHPQRTAVSAADGGLSYGELAARSATVASGLIESGVRPGDTVAVAMPRSRDLLVALLGVLRAGAAYVPVDPTTAPDRRSAILEDSRCRVVLTTIDDVSGTATPADAAVDPDATAYVLFTSGSTGRPKGVAITHGGAVNMIRWAATEFTPAELARTLAVTPTTFDLSVFELFLPLAVGGTVCLLDTVLDLLTPPPHLGAPTLLNTVPSAVAALVEQHALSPSLLVVNMAGEPLPADLVRSVHEQRPGVRVFNLYGPSETTTYSAYTELDAATGEPVPIGGPVGGTTLAVVDANLRPAPAGAVGELIIGGAGVAAGYLGRPDLTAARFLPDPTGGGRRVYRTGDLVRQRPDGRLDFLGRSDDQVKVRGYRIELGEVETALRKVAAVREVAVCAVGDGRSRRLVGHLVPAAVPADTVAWLQDVRQALLGKLPGYMVPGSYAVHDRLPRTGHGKVDRRRLADAEVIQLGRRRRVEPRTDVERRIAGLWGQVLGRPDVGVTEDFLELGGHSLLLARLGHLLTEEFDAELPLGELWRCRTVATQARFVETARPRVVRIRAVDRSQYTSRSS